MPLPLSLPSHLILLFLFLLTGNGKLTKPKCSIHPPYNNIFLVSFLPTTPSHLTAITNLLLTKPCPPLSISEKPPYLHHPQPLLLTSHQYHHLLPRIQPPLPSPTLHTSNLFTLLANSPQQRDGYSRPPSPQRRKNAPPPLDDAFYKNFSTYQDLSKKWQTLSRIYAPHVRITTIAKSLENRDITALRIGTTDPANPKRLFLNGLQHAREWISVHVVTYIAETLAIAAATDTGEIAALLKSVEVVLVPLVNPDGYVYSHVRDRFARKNRRKAGCQSPERDGVDLNRNWSKDFGGKGSTSTDPCSESFIGTAAFSEPESRGMRDFIRSIPGIKAHVDFHSFGQLVLGAWSHSFDVAPRANESKHIGEAVRSAMSLAEGKLYRYGAGGKTLYLASGTMSDWTMAEGILSFTVELRPSMGVPAYPGFDLQESEIGPTCREGVAATRILLLYTNDSSLIPSRVHPTMAPPPDKENSPAAEGDGGLDVPFVAGISAAGAVFVVLVVLIIIVMRRKNEVVRRDDANRFSFDSTGQAKSKSIDSDGSSSPYETTNTDPLS